MGSLRNSAPDASGDVHGNSGVLKARLLKKIKENSNGCWEWQAHKGPRGYGRINTKIGTLAHRVSWQVYNGRIPDGVFVCHKCDNPSCINPEHLFLGTNTDNVRDCFAKGRGKPPKPKGKLTEAQARHIKSFSAIANRRSIATLYGVTVDTVDDIRNGRTWKHL